MPLSWNEIRSNAIAFAKEWEKDSSEDAEAKSFWDQFLRVFGVNRRRVAQFEKMVEKAGGKAGYIDLFWSGVLIAEHKSRGKSLDKAFTQAIDYFPNLSDKELPRYVVVSDFERIRLTDLEAEDSEQADFEFALRDLPQHINRFGFIAGYQVHRVKEQDPVNMKAAEKLADLHDALKGVGYSGHQLEVYLVRLLFCMFADDTGIFMPRGAFEDYLIDRTAADGSDLASKLDELFHVLNTPEERRLKNLDEQLAAFPYVNGRLFEERLAPAAFTREMRDKLLACSELDWGGISPAIFGSMFQGIMDPNLRGILQAHYTSETNILRAIGPLFLDELKAEFDRIRHQQAKLEAFHNKLAALNIFDPACGCGNFLVVSYREIRLLELEVIKKLHGKDVQQLSLDAAKQYVKVDVDRFHGIEIDDWASQIARVAMWLIDHQMNLQVGEAFGQTLVRIPLVKSANIVNANALRIDWNEVVPSHQCSHLVGNPPFFGKARQTDSQKEDLNIVRRGIPGSGVLDYVAGWYIKAAKYLTQTSSAALVSTNSIIQGEQVGVLWGWMLENGIHINFAHRTFKWKNEAKSNAAVHCVIIGFAKFENADKILFDYEHVSAEPQRTSVKRINPYLVDAENVLPRKRNAPISKAPSMCFGSMANDGGFLLLSDDEREEILKLEPDAARWIRSFIQVDELLYGTTRWCLWLNGISATELNQLPMVRERVRQVKESRLKSPRPQTKKLAKAPALFGEIRQPSGDYLVVPRHTGEDRIYIPMARYTADTICGDANLLIADPTLYVFGVVQSLMHMAWVRAICGRIKSDYRYSVQIVYNNFPWCDPTAAQRQAIEDAAQGVLDARLAHPSATLADLYDPLTTPSDLLKAHQKLDRAVDAAYGKRDFRSEAERVAFLLGKYQELTSSLTAAL